MKGTKQIITTKPKIIFITGTDTGVGKTILTALLLSHLRQQGRDALAMKPFCSGSTNGLTDVEILYQLQDKELGREEINPFFFPEPLAPLVAARHHGMRITLDDVVQGIRATIEKRLSPIQNIQDPILIIEGAGGLLAPLGEGFNLIDLVSSFALADSDSNPKSKSPRPSKATAGIQNSKWGIRVIVVARNQLGTLNHTLLTVRALQNLSKYRPEFTDHSVVAAKHREGRSLITSVVLMAPADPDLSSRTNPKILSELLDPMPVFLLPHITGLAGALNETRRKSVIARSAKTLRKTLSRILR